MLLVAGDDLRAEASPLAPRSIAVGFLGIPCPLASTAQRGLCEEPRPIREHPCGTLLRATPADAN